MGDVTAADRISRQLLSLQPGNLSPLLDLAEQAIETGEPEGIQSALAVVRQSDDPAVHARIAAQLLASDRRMDAQGLLWEARGRFEDHPRLTLLWLQHFAEPSDDEQARMAVAILEATDDWDVVASAFELYLGFLRQRGLVEWAARHHTEAYELSPEEYRRARTALLLSMEAEDWRSASRLLEEAAASSPASLPPEVWVISALTRWPNPGAMSLLRRLGATDPAGRWRYDVLGARLLAEDGRHVEARSALIALEGHVSSNPAALFDAGSVYETLPDLADLEAGCALREMALELEPRSMTYRLGVVDCLRETAQLEAGYGVALAGFEVVRDSEVADQLYDRLISALPAGTTVEMARDAVRERVDSSRPALRRWVEALGPR